MENEKGIVKLSRKQIYDDVWELSVAGVARKHNLNYARLIETRRQEELRKRKENEIKLTKELVNKAEDYRNASEIRSYINAMIESGNEEATSEWIEWARQKADWYDPTVACEDEYLGKREHGKSKEDKDLDKIPVRRSGWYW